MSTVILSKILFMYRRCKIMRSGNFTDEFNAATDEITHRLFVGVDAADKITHHSVYCHCCCSL